MQFGIMRPGQFNTFDQRKLRCRTKFSDAAPNFSAIRIWLNIEDLLCNWAFTPTSI
jgi:hypothetical protein